jgi:hypothetical protein
VRVELQGPGRQRAGRAAGAQRKARQRVGADRGLPRAQFAPCDGAVAVGIQADGVLEVAQRDIPLPAHAGGVRLHRQVAVARLVGVGGAGEERQQQGEEPHRSRSATWRRRGSS